jgi:hypothetical protein
MRKALNALIFTGVVGMLGCQQENNIALQQAPLTVLFSHKASNNPLTLGKSILNPFGEAYTINSFSYYVSHFSLITEQGMPVDLPVSYFLVNEKQPASKKISFIAPAGNYKAIRLMIGVDSTRNVSGVQSGALDPANGMFWTWNTGYIYAKLEAKSPASNAPLQNVTYHIGGFASPNNAIRVVELPLPNVLALRSNGQASLSVEANIDTWFNGKTPLRIAEEAFCMNPGALALKISDNYSKMFTVIKANN